MYDISDGRSVIRQAVDDYYVMGVGYIHVYQDPMMDMGKGEVCFHDIDPLDVYVDPNSRHKLFDDAENIIISRLFTKEQAKKMWPMYSKAIDNAADNSGSRFDFNAPSTEREDDGEVQFPEDVGRLNNQDYIRGYERYYRVDVDEYRVHEVFEEDVQTVLSDCKKLYHNFYHLPEEVQLIIANMMFNMGLTRLSKFKGMKRGVDDCDWQAAADEMVDSRWYRQVTNRAERLVERMRNV